MKCQIPFSGKKETKIITWSSAEFAQRVVKVNLLLNVSENNRLVLRTLDLQVFLAVARLLQQLNYEWGAGLDGSVGCVSDW